MRTIGWRRLTLAIVAMVLGCVSACAYDGDLTAPGGHDPAHLPRAQARPSEAVTRARSARSGGHVGERASRPWNADAANAASRRLRPFRTQTDLAT